MKLKVCYTDVSVDHIVYCDSITFYPMKDASYACLINKESTMNININWLKYIFIANSTNH